MTARPPGRSGVSITLPDYVPMPDRETCRRAALTVCALDPDHAADTLDALGLLDVLREGR